MEKKSNKKGMSTGAMVGIGAGVAAATVAGYLLFGPEGKKNRKTVKGWAVKMKGEIIEKLESVKELTEPVYHDIINKAQEKYAKIKNMDKEELAALVTDMKKHWKAISNKSKPKRKTKAKQSKAASTKGKSKAK